MPIIREPTLPYRAGFAMGRGKTMTQTREMQFKIAFEDVRAKRTMEQLAMRFKDAQERLQMATQAEQEREQEKAGAEALGMEAARRGEDVSFKNPYSALAYAETRRQMGVEIPEEELRGFAEELGYDPELAERIPRVWRGLPAAARGAIVSRAPALAGKGRTVEDQMRMASGKMRDYMLARGTPKTPKEFTERAQEYEKQVWTKEQAKTRAEAMEDADEAFRAIYSDVSAEEGYDQFDSIEKWLQSIGFSKEEIDSIAEKKYEWGRPGPNKYTDIKWNKLRQILFQKRLARMGGTTKPAPGEGVRSKTEAFLESVERE